jgi:hypothetical protein
MSWFGTPTNFVWVVPPDKVSDRWAAALVTDWAPFPHRRSYARLRPSPRIVRRIASATCFHRSFSPQRCQDNDGPPKAAPDGWSSR